MGGYAPASRRGQAIDPAHVPLELLQAAQKSWDEVVEHVKSHERATAGLGASADRNHRLHDGLRHHRHRARGRAGEVQKLVGGGTFKIVNRTVPLALLRSNTKEEIRATSNVSTSFETIENAPRRARAPPVFDCLPCCHSTRSIHYPDTADARGGAAVPSGAISKTINMPSRRSTIQQRHTRGGGSASGGGDLSRQLQAEPAALPPEKQPAAAAGPVIEYRARRRKLPDERRAITLKFSINGTRAT